MSYRKAFVPIVLLVIASLILATGMNTSPGLAKPDVTKVPLPVDETVTPDPPDPGEDWPGPWFKQNSLAGVNYYDHYRNNPLPDMTPDLYGQRGWNVIVVNNALSDCKYGLTNELGAALAAKEEHGLINIVRIDYTQQNGQNIAVPRYSKGEDYIQWLTAFALCVSRFRDYRPPESKNDETHDLATIFIVGNEPNLDGNVFPDEYYLAYNALWNAKSDSGYSDTQFLAAGPSAFSPDSIKWMAEMTRGLKNVDGFAIHTYGIRESCEDPQQPCDMNWEYDGGFRFYRDLIEGGINDIWWGKPVYITEFNTWPGDKKEDGTPVNTPSENYIAGWIQKAFSDVRDYNANRGNKPAIKALNWFVDKSDVQWNDFSLLLGRDPGNPRLHQAFLDMQTEFHNPANRGELAAIIDETGSNVPLYISPGETRRVTVRVWNMGKTWSASQSYGLAVTSNNQMIVGNPDCGSTLNGDVTILLICNDDVPFLGTHVFSFDITMPVTASNPAKLELQMALSTTVDSSREYLFWFGDLQSWQIKSINNPLAAGYNHTCALTSIGGVKCWGDNADGQLGDDSIIDRSTPVDVAGLGNGVFAITAGGYHTCALTNSGGVKCWGNNDYGQLGDGTEDTDRWTPVDVVGLDSGVIAIAAGGYHTCALINSGGVKCWGNNGGGQLGDGTISATRLTPVDVVGLNSSVTGIAAGHAHTCAVVSTGGVKCWGDNTDGQLGDGTSWPYYHPTPVDVINLNDIVSITAGGHNWDFTCALTSVGGAKCWGSNLSGQLGDGSQISTRYQPVDVFGLSGGVLRIMAGTTHTCAVIASGGVKCWGGNAYGQLGDGTLTSHRTPVDVIGLVNDGIVIVDGGDFHTCAMTGDEGVKCWGHNADGQLGNGTTNDSLTPVNVIGLP